MCLCVAETRADASAAAAMPFVEHVSDFLDGVGASELFGGKMGYTFVLQTRTIRMTGMTLLSASERGVVIGTL